MAENFYDGLFILDANKFAADPHGGEEKVNALIQKCGGQILASRLWQEHRLAYPINGHRRGIYWLTYFKMEGVKIAELEHEAHLSENIIRCLFVKLDPRIVDALVRHALEGTLFAHPPAEGGAPAREGVAAE